MNEKKHDEKTIFFDDKSFKLTYKIDAGEIFTINETNLELPIDYDEKNFEDVNKELDKYRDLLDNGKQHLNKILESKLKIYNDSNQEKQFSLLINSNKEKKISSKDTKGNPKTYEIKITVKVSGKHSNGQLKEKIFVKLISYNNKENKFDLKKYENETSKIFIEKIAEDLIIYLQTV